MTKTSRRGISPALLSLLLVPLVGCAGQEVPRAEHIDTKSSLKAAQVAGAQEVPQASLYLKMAQDGVEQAEMLFEEEQYDKAKRVLERAKMDAELALTMTREAEMREKAEAEKERLRKLEDAVMTKSPKQEREG